MTLLGTKTVMEYSLMLVRTRHALITTRLEMIDAISCHVRVRIDLCVPIVCFP